MGRHRQSDPAACSIFSCPIYRDAFNFYIKEQNYFTSLELNGKFETWEIGHNLLVGTDGYRASNLYSPLVGNFSTVLGSDLFNPGYPTV